MSCSRWLKESLWVLAVVVALSAVSPGVEARAAAAPSSKEIETTTDDGLAGSMALMPAMDEHHYKGTFFVHSSKIGQTGMLSSSQLRELQSDGHEIGGHTLTHPHLTQLTEAQQRTEICNDRQALVNGGFSAVSFAYPFGEFTATTKKVAASCGYNSARATGGLPTGAPPYAELTPPHDNYSIRSFGSIQSTTTVKSMLDRVDIARANGGGWLPYIFHWVCPESNPGCNTYGITVSAFTAFVDGLHDRNVRVRTIGQVTPVTNPSFDTDANADGIPDCWTTERDGSNNGVGSRVTGPRTGAYAWNITIGSYSSGDARLISNSRCTIRAEKGKSVTAVVWYKGTTAKPRLAAFIPDGDRGWRLWSSSPTYGTVSGWTKITWTTPPATTSSFRLAVMQTGAGSVTFDDVGAY
jgi:peptidoglycan/xylan/chitin deacetylase (PgdA/CDA1 family)